MALLATAPLLLGAMACGSSGSSGTDCGSVEKGCVDLLNFGSTSANIFQQGQSAGSSNLIPPASNNGTSLTPGKGSTSVSSTVGTMIHFDSSPDSVPPGGVTCTVSSTAWISVNPAVVRQQTGQLTCSDF